MKTRVSWVVLLILIGGLTVPAAAQQTATVSGAITDSLSGDVVPNALVILESPSFTRQVKTGTDGRFSIANAPTGAYHLIVRADGYLPSRTEITVQTTAPSVDVRINPELHFSEVTSVSPEGKSQFESFQATNVLGGQELTKEMQGTLGATLENQPGIALRSFGPGPARPVVRGLDGDRVLVVEDGLRMGDLSSQSGDHGVNVNPASASRIEVVRGPATLLYGANAIGGLVNVITNEIPERAGHARHRVASRSTPASGAKEGGARRRRHGRQRATSRCISAAAAAAPATFDRRTATSRTRSAAPAFAEVGLAYTDRQRLLRRQLRVRPHALRHSVRRRRRDEPQSAPPDLHPARREAEHGRRRSIRVPRLVRRPPLPSRRDATAKRSPPRSRTTRPSSSCWPSQGARPDEGIDRRDGADARVRGRGRGSALAAGRPEGFAGVPLRGGGGHRRTSQFQFGGRVEHAKFDPAAGRGVAIFTNFSGSVGLLLLPNDSTTIAFSLARASRNPALEELYFHGPHAGNNAFENGDPNLDSEHALGFDASLRWRGARASGEVTFFVNRIDNFIFRELSGAVEDDLPETFFAQGDARLQGVESHVDVRVGADVWLEGGLDYVRGELTALDKPLPRMPPLRGRAGLRLQKNAFQAGADGVFTAKQDRILHDRDAGRGRGRDADGRLQPAEAVRVVLVRDRENRPTRSPRVSTTRPTRCITTI